MANCQQRPRSACSSGRCRITADEYLGIIASALPRGTLWVLDDERHYSKFWVAIAHLLAWFQNVLCAALDEFFPCYSEELLDRHADAWGYPVECMGYPTSAEQLCEWIALTNSPCFGNNLWTLKALIDFSGIDYVEKIEEISTPPFVIGCGTTCQSLGPSPNANSGCYAQCCKLVITLGDAFFAQCKPFMLGSSCCGSSVCQPLGAYDKRGLDCIVRRYFSNTAPVYISNSTGTQSILIAPSSICFE